MGGVGAEATNQSFFSRLDMLNFEHKINQNLKNENLKIVLHSIQYCVNFFITMGAILRGEGGGSAYSYLGQVRSDLHARYSLRFYFYILNALRSGLFLVNM